MNIARTPAATVTFLFLVHETPMFALQVMRSLAGRIRQLDDQL